MMPRRESTQAVFIKPIERHERVTSHTDPFNGGGSNGEERGGALLIYWDVNSVTWSRLPPCTFLCVPKLNKEGSVSGASHWMASGLRGRIVLRITAWPR